MTYNEIERLGAGKLETDLSGPIGSPFVAVVPKYRARAFKNDGPTMVCSRCPRPPNGLPPSQHSTPATEPTWDDGPQHQNEQTSPLFQSMTLWFGPRVAQEL